MGVGTTVVPALRLAVRDLRGALREFAVFLACIALGVATIAAVGNLNASVIGAFKRDAAALLGGDLQLETVGVPIPADDLDAVLPQGARLSTVIRTNSLLSSPAGKRLPIEIKAVDGAYPLLGQTELEPSIPLADALAGDGIVAKSAALARLGVALGESLRLGEATVRIKAVLTREPDRVGGLFSFGPRVLMSEELLRTSGLVRPGALVRYEYRIDLPLGADPDLAAAAIKAARPDAGWRVQSSTEVQPRVARLTDRLATFLALAGLTSLVIGGLGVAMAVQTHLARRTGAIATLKCLGAVGRQIMAVYLLQTVLLAALGSLLGLLAGGGLLLLLHRLAGRAAGPARAHPRSSGSAGGSRRRHPDRRSLRAPAADPGTRRTTGGALPLARCTGAWLATPRRPRPDDPGSTRPGRPRHRQRAAARSGVLVRPRRCREPRHPDRPRPSAAGGARPLPARARPAAQAGACQPARLRRRGCGRDRGPGRRPRHADDHGPAPGQPCPRGRPAAAGPCAGPDLHRYPAPASGSRSPGRWRVSRRRSSSRRCRAFAPA